MQAGAEHVRFPGNVTRVIDEVEIARQLGEHMHQICSSRHKRHTQVQQPDRSSLIMHVAIGDSEGAKKRGTQ